MHDLIIGRSFELDTTVEIHIHPGWEIVLILEGHGYDIINGTNYPFKPGSITCIPPNTQHSTYSEGYTCIYLHPTYFSLTKYADVNNVIKLHDDSVKSFESLMTMAHRAFNEKDEKYAVLVNTLYEAMCHLLKILISREPVEPDIENVKNKLLGSFSNPNLSISEIISDAPYCKDHMRRRFKKATGMTLMDYLTGLRLNFAKKLMTENKILNYSISEIAAMSGYYDNQYFSRIFKQKVGMTPMEFLQK